MSDKMREEFEAVLREDCEASGMDAPDLRISPCVLDDGAPIYINDMTQACWWAYRKGWQASRESLVIELPKIRRIVIGRRENECDSGFNDAIDLCTDAIVSAGLKVKP